MTTQPDNGSAIPSCPPPQSPKRSRRKRILLTLAALAAGVPLLIWGWQSYRTRHDRREALALFQAGHYAEAEPLLRRSLERRDDDVEVLRALALLTLAGPAPESAEPLLLRWGELRPADVEPRKKLLDFYRQEQKYEQAMAAAREVLAREPDDETTQRRLAESCISAGHFDEAERALAPCLERQPRDRRLRLLLAEVKRGRGQNQEALAILTQLLEEYPRSPGVLLFAGILYRETGRPEKAIPLLEKVLLLGPRRVRSARYQLSMALEQAGRHDEAQRMAADLRRLQDIQVLRELMPSRPDDLDLKVRLAELLFLEGDDRQARGLLDEVLRRDPHFAEAGKLRARYAEK